MSERVRLSHVRTVQDGRVRIRGRWWRPSGVHLPYDGRLDGHRFLFLLYPHYPSAGRYDMAALWGTEAAYRSEYIGEWSVGPECVGGTFPWYFWHPEDARAPSTNSSISAHSSGDGE